MTCILALDTSTDACSVALATESGVVGLFELAVKTHTQRLLPMIDELLTQEGVQLADLDAIAFGRGPGSFTGLRIGLGVVQGLAYARRLPVIPVSTLTAMAVRHFRHTPDTSRPVLTALDARMGEVYWALFAPESGQLNPRVMVEEQVMSPQRVAEHPDVGAMGVNFEGVGPGWQYAALQALAPAVLEPVFHPRAEDIARLGMEAYARGEAIPIQQAQPVYLRNTVSWKKRTRIRS